MEAALGALDAKIGEVSETLRDTVLFEKKGIGTNDYHDYLSATEGFRTRHGVHLLESGLSSRFIRLGFRYGLGPNAPYDAESTLGEAHKKIHEEHEKGRSCVESSQARMERQLSVTTAFYSVEESIRGVWWTLIVAAVVSVFQADLRKIIGSLCGRALRGFAR